MAHFAELNENNVVIKVHCLHDAMAPTEVVGQDYLRKIHKNDHRYIQTSYNTLGGKYYINDGPRELAFDQSKAFRKNYAGRGFTWDDARDAFIPIKPWPSWILDEDTCFWKPPIAHPGGESGREGLTKDSEYYAWNEDTGNWVVLGSVVSDSEVSDSE